MNVIVKYLNVWNPAGFVKMELCKDEVVIIATLLTQIFFFEDDL